jgi:ABC-type multidrug transport system permease subunit
MIKIALKDIRIFLRDIKGLLLTFLLPIVLITLFGLAFGGLARNSAKDRPANIYVADLDSSAASIQTIQKLDSLDEIALTHIALEVGKENVMNGNRLAMLVFYQGFGDSIESGGAEPVELFYDDARELEASLIQYALISNLMEIMGSQSIRKKIMKSVNQRFPDVDSSIMADIEDEIALQFTPVSNKEDTLSAATTIGTQIGSLKVSPLARKKSIDWALIQSFAGTAVMMLLFGVAAIGSSLLGERDEGTLKRLLYAPMNPLQILFGKMLFSMLLATIQLIVMLAFTVWVLGLEINGNLFYVFLLIITTAYACASFGVFIASISGSRKQAESLATIVILIMSAIGGSMIPLFFMPAFMRKMAMVTINYWSIQGFFDVLGRNAGFMDIALSIAMLLLIGTAMTVVSAFLFRKHIYKVA